MTLIAVQSLYVRHFASNLIPGTDLSCQTCSHRTSSVVIQVDPIGLPNGSSSGYNPSIHHNVAVTTFTSKPDDYVVIDN